ncbi:GNAT family N-acetyltransferase [Maribacter sp.]|nr:GNAT family N-acetyltransferase [Maribacter sp.]
MVLKKAALIDLIDLRNICIAAYSKNFYNHWEEGGLEWYVDKEFSTKKLTSDLNDHHTEYYFIEHEQKAVGFIKIRNNSVANSSIENAVELEKIYVLPECKGMGIGKSALKDIIKRITAAGAKNIFLGVIDTNINAIAFYEKIGFEMHSKTSLDIPYFKVELKGMYRMVKKL